MRILSIVVRHGTTAYPDAERDLDALMRARLPAVSRDTIVVDNAAEPGEHERTDGRVVIGGDNSAWEFSGFDAGVRHAGRTLDEYDAVHLVTSAFNQLYTGYLARFEESLVARAMAHGAAIGHVDCYNEPVAIRERPLQHWLRSCFLMLPPSEVRLLGSFVSVSDPAEFFEPGASFREAAPVSLLYRRYITDWLGGGDIGQGMTWHSRLDAAERGEAFQRKAMAIFNEHLLSARLRGQGCAVTDVTWLASELARGRAPSWDTPWRVQLATRDEAQVHAAV